jgi:hypothetical protein
MKRPMVTKGVILLLLAAGMLLAGSGAVRPLAGVLAGAAWAEEAWKAEFEDVCGKTADAAECPVDELKKLVDRCDKLKPQIETLEATPRKVYLRRLQMCRDLYAYVLESKLQEKPKQ